MQFARLKSGFVSQLMRAISRVLQKFLKYFNGKIISTSLLLQVAHVLSVIIALNVNDSESVILSFGRLCGTAVHFLIFLQNSYCTLLDYNIGITTSTFFASSTWVFFISLIQSVSDLQLLNVTCLFLLFVYLDTASAPAAVIVMVSFTSYGHHCNYKDLNESWYSWT